MTSQSYKIAGQLAAMNNAPKDYIDVVDDQTGFAIITANTGSPINANSRYVEDNPFPGFRVQCLAQVQIGGEWHTTGYFNDGTNYLVQASYDESEDKIKLTTGAHGLAATPNAAGGSSDITSAHSTASPGRILVWKVKGAVT